MKDKIIVAANPGGISNRIKCLISMWRLSDEVNKKLYLYWIKNKTCGADFSDLFENEFSEISKEELKELSVEECILSHTFRFITLTDEVPDKFAKVYPTDRGNNIDFEFERIPQKVRENILLYLHKLKPIKTIRYIVDNFTEKYDVSNLVGVHVRRDDFLYGKERLGDVSSNKKFFEKMNEILNDDSSTKFLLCTDSQETEDKFIEEFGDRIIIYQKKNRDRTTKIVTQQGLIDLLLLSKTKHIIGTYRSTFNELAWWLGDCKAKVDIIIDEDLKKQYELNKGKFEKSKWLKIKKSIYKLFTKIRIFKK